MQMQIMRTFLQENIFFSYKEYRLCFLKEEADAIWRN